MTAMKAKMMAMASMMGLLILSPNRGKRAPVQAMAQSSTTMPGGGGDKVCGHCG